MTESKPLAEVDELQAEIARLRDGEDVAPRNPAEYGSAGQIWHELLNADAPRRLAFLDGGIRNARLATACFQENHPVEINWLRKRAEAAESKIAKVRALHRPADGRSEGHCLACWEAGGEDGAPMWPCPTIVALEEDA